MAKSTRTQRKISATRKTIAAAQTMLRNTKQTPARKLTKPLTAAEYARAGTEHAHQTALFVWAAQESPPCIRADLRSLFAIPNGGKRDAITAARLKAEGVRAGVPDIFLPVGKGRHLGLFIEMKRPGDLGRKGVVSDEQRDRITSLRMYGYACAVCYSWEYARSVLLVYLDLKPFERLPEMEG